MRRALFTVAAGVALLLVAAAPAGAWMKLGLDSTDPGRIAVWVWGSGTFTSVDVHGTGAPARTVVPAFVQTPAGPVTGQRFAGFARWRCSRLTRSFVAVGHRADGSVETAQASLRTPSCRRRFALIAPRRVRPGARVAVRVRDRFRLGGGAGRLCVRAPRGTWRCRRAASVRHFRAARRGHWRVRLTTRWQHVHTVVSAGVRAPARLPALPVVLATGDSLMESVDAVLGDRLADRARERSDVRLGSALTKPFFTDWSTLPGQQVRRWHPRATVVFLGTNDAWPVRVGGTEVPCCGAGWVAGYARLARRAMKAYLRGGGAVVWLNVPAARDPRRAPISTAVDAGLARAATGLRRAVVLDMNARFTPGGVYRAYMTVHGRRVRVRERDGIHLTPAGAALAARPVIAALERFGVV